MKKIYSIYFILFVYLSLQIQVKAQISGTVTVNSLQATGGTNYQTFSALAAKLNTAGVSGPLYVNVVANTGPYVEQPVFYQAPGVSPTNTITVNGNNNVLTFNSGSSAQPWTLLLNGADYMNFNSLNVVGQGTVYALSCMLCLGADNNTFSNCGFSVSPGGVSSYQVPVSICGSSVNVNAGLSGKNNTFISCSMKNGYYGAVMTGSASSPFSVKNSIIKCYLSDWYYCGVYATNQQSVSVSYCSLDRPTRIQSGSACYGINFNSGMQGGVKCLGNCLQNFYGSANNSTVTTYAIYHYQPASGLPTNTFSNNLIDNLGASGAVYGIYSISSISGVCNSNTVILNNTAATSTLGAYGIYAYNSPPDSCHISNNYISITQGGLGAKYGIYSAVLANTLINYNRFFISTPSSMSFIGYSPNTGAAATFTAWQGGGYDLQGINYSSNPNTPVACPAPGPTSSFSISSLAKCAGSPVVFYDNSTDNPTSWSWNVNPNTSVTIVSPASQNPQITFNSPGTYTVTLVASNSVAIGSTFTQTIGIAPSPVILISPSSATTCAGAPASFTASGASSYIWNPGNLNTNTISVAPSSSTTYTCIGTNSSNCVGSNTISMNIIPCTGIIRPHDSVSFKIYPNPSQGEFTLECDHIAAHLCIFDLLGQKVLDQEITENRNIVSASLPSGIYLVHLVKDGNVSSAVKLVVE
jgi:hypothetical protein